MAASLVHTSADAAWEEAWADPSFLEALVAATPPAATGGGAAGASLARVGADAAPARRAAPHLPQDVLTIIFAHCESATLLACAAGVCRQWRAAAAAADVRPWAKLVLRGVPAGCARVRLRAVERRGCTHAHLRRRAWPLRRCALAN
jgi:hypothetical protein